MDPPQIRADTSQEPGPYGPSSGPLEPKELMSRVALDHYVPAALTLPETTRLKHIDTWLVSARDHDKHVVALQARINQARMYNHKRILHGLKTKKAMLR